MYSLSFNSFSNLVILLLDKPKQFDIYSLHEKKEEKFFLSTIIQFYYILPFHSEDSIPILVAFLLLFSCNFDYSFGYSFSLLNKLVCTKRNNDF